jgi:AcrR family transcriptional regulator
VLDAAVVEFATGGFAGTSTEAIARRAGISQPYLFRLYPTKRALFIAATERCFDRVTAAFEGAAAGLAGDAALEAMGFAYGGLLSDRSSLLAQLHAYAACDDPAIRAVVQQRFGQLWELVERVSGAPVERVRDFFAHGMLMNVAAAMDLPSVSTKWARAICGPWQSDT